VKFPAFSLKENLWCWWHWLPFSDPTKWKRLVRGLDVGKAVLEEALAKHPK